MPGSIFDTPPRETGAVAARLGYAYKDHVAAGFAVEGC